MARLTEVSVALWTLTFNRAVRLSSWSTGFGVIFCIAAASLATGNGSRD